MFVKDQRIQQELEKFLKQKMLRKEVPSMNDIFSYIKDIETQFNLDNSLINIEQLRVNEGEVASASKQNTTFGLIENEISLVYKAISNLSEIGDETLFQNLGRLALLKNKTKKLDSRVRGLLMTTSLTDGYYDLIDEPLITLDKVDFDNTTVDIDLASSTCTIKESVEVRAPSSRYFPDMAQTKIKFGTLARTKLLAETPVDSKTPENALDDLSQPWLHKIVYQTGTEPLVCELKIDFGEVVRLSKICFEKYMPAEVGVASLRILYSKDGSEYLAVPSGQNDYVITDVVTAIFPPTDMKVVKFLFTKHYYDEKIDNNFIYYVGADKITFYEATYDETNGNIFQSLPLSVYKNTGEEDTTATPEVKDITSVACEVCETTNEENTIEYSISFDGTTFYPISPVSEKNPQFPKTISVVGTSNAEWKNLTLILDSVKSSWSFLRKENSYNLPISTDISSAIEEEVIAYRGVGKPYHFESQNDSDILFGYHFESKGIPQGWTFDGSYYATTITVSTGVNLSLDFGPKPVYINNIEKTGVVVLSPGDYLVQVKPESWSPLLNNVTPGTPFLVTEILDNTGGTFTAKIQTITESGGVYSYGGKENATLTDPLFPYNHRLLIEGLPYASSFEGIITYNGAYRFAAYKCSRVSDIDFEYKVANNDPKKFFICEAVGPSGNTKTLVFKKNDDNIYGLDADDDFDQVKKRNRELIDIVARTFDENAGSTTAVIFRATLKSRNGSSPLFHGFRLKLGVING